MHTRHAFDYAIVRVVPRVERGEFVNAGVIVFSPTARFLDARIHLDTERLHAIAPGIDLDVVQNYLDVIPRICAGGDEAGAIGCLSQSERCREILARLVAPRSTMIQMSPVHAGVHSDLRAALEQLFARMVR